MRPARSATAPSRPRVLFLATALVLLLTACAVPADGPTTGYDGAATTGVPSQTIAVPTDDTEAPRSVVAGLTADGDDGAADDEGDELLDADRDDASDSEDGAGDESGETGGTIVAHALADSVTAHTAPYAAAPEVDRFANPTDRGGPLVFMAVDEPRNGWLEVLLPVRPNGTTGWIRVDEVELTVNPFAIEVDVDEHRLTILRFGEERLSTDVAIGTGDTPTPIGEFYLVELLRPSNPDGAYGPFAYGLSGFSETLDSFNGGEGIIGIHGTNRPDLIGQDVSHGCIRVPNPTIEEMARFLPLGTPVRIHRDQPEGGAEA